MVTDETIRYWAELAQEELNCFDDIEEVIFKFISLRDNGLLETYEYEDKGVFAYMIADEITRKRTMIELFMYIKPEHRGMSFLRFIKGVENEAKNKACKNIVIGSNIGYRDDKVLSVLNKLGYKTDMVIKEVK